MGNWKLTKAGDCPTNPKKEEEGGSEKSFLSIQNAVLLHRPDPSVANTGDVKVSCNLTSLMSSSHISWA